MMLSGERARQIGAAGPLIEGYSEFCDFNPASCA